MGARVRVRGPAAAARHARRARPCARGTPRPPASPRALPRCRRPPRASAASRQARRNRSASPATDRDRAAQGRVQHRRCRRGSATDARPAACMVARDGAAPSVSDRGISIASADAASGPLHESSTRELLWLGKRTRGGGPSAGNPARATHSARRRRLAPRLSGRGFARGVPPAMGIPAERVPQRWCRRGA